MATKHIKKLTIDDIRTFLYQERFSKNITGSFQASNMGLDSVTCLGRILYPASRRELVLLRVINYILTQIGGVYYEEIDENPKRY